MKPISSKLASALILGLVLLSFSTEATILAQSEKASIEESGLEISNGPTEHTLYWIKILQKHPFNLIRKSAARNLGQIGDKMTIQTLVRALEDPFHGVRTEAARALAKMGEEEALPGLFRIQKHDADASVRRAAEIAIDKIHMTVQYRQEQEEKRKALEEASKETLVQ